MSVQPPLSNETASLPLEEKVAAWALANGQPAREVLEFLANTLTNRLMHEPSKRLRQAAETGDPGTVDAIAAIYRTDAEQ